MRTNANRFQKGSGCFTCRMCGKKTRDTGGDNGPVELCERCYDMAGDENMVLDGHMTQAEYDEKWGAPEVPFKAAPVTPAAHTPTPYQIGRIEETETYTVGKNNSLTEVFHFEKFEDALMKLLELRGDDFIVRAVNSHEELLEAARKGLWCAQKLWDETKGTEREGTAMTSGNALESLKKAIAKAEGGVQ